VGSGKKVNKQSTNKKPKKKQEMWRCQKTQMKPAEHNAESRHKQDA
jgi:hypothetical protein